MTASTSPCRHRHTTAVIPAAPAVIPAQAGIARAVAHQPVIPAQPSVIPAKAGIALALFSHEAMAEQEARAKSDSRLRGNDEARRESACRKP